MGTCNPLERITYSSFEPSSDEKSKLETATSTLTVSLRLGICQLPVFNFHNLDLQEQINYKERKSSALKRSPNYYLQN